MFQIVTAADGKLSSHWLFPKVKKKKKWILILHNKIPKQPLVKDFFKNPQKTKTKRAQTPSTSRSCYVLPSVRGWIPSLGQLHYPREKETGVNNNTHTQDTPGMNGTLSKSWWSRLQWRRQQHFKTHTSWVYCSETGSVIFVILKHVSHYMKQKEAFYTDALLISALTSL